jgi:hypothetical protein
MDRRADGYDGREGGRMRATTISATTTRRKPLACKERVKVLVVLHANGWAEVYADDHVDVRVVNRLFVENEDAMLANTIDAYMEGTMPRTYRNLYWPRKLRATGLCEKVTPEKALDSLYTLNLIRGLRQLREEASR